LKMATLKFALRFRFPLGLAVGLSPFLASSHVAASGGLRTVALTGDAAPGVGGGAFSTFGLFDAAPPVLNNGGHVAFSGRLSGTGGFTNDSGMWSEGGGSGLALVAREGSTAPGTSVGFSDFLDTQAVLNQNGQVAFSGFLDTSNPAVNSSNFRGLWSEGHGGGLALIARAGAAAPGTGVSFREVFSDPVINTSGRTAFGNLVTGPGVTSANSSGVWSEGGGSLALVAREGSAAPGTPAGFLFGNIDAPVLNAQGRMAFRATMLITGPGSPTFNEGGVWKEQSGGLALVSRAGNAAPGAGGGSFLRFGDNSVRINSQGQVAFRAGLSLTGGIDNNNNDGVWSEGAGSGLALIAREGDPAPGLPAGVLFDLNTFSNSMALNNNGHAAFIGGFRGAEFGSAIWSEGQGSGLALVARSGASAPGVEAGVGFGFFADRTVVLNNNGRTAFRADLVGPGIDSTNDSGLWAEDSAGMLRLIAREGGLLDVSDDPLSPDLRTVSVLSWIVGNTGNGDGRASSYNDLGQVTFAARFTDGSEGVFVSNLVAVPEPTSLAMLVALGMAGVCARRGGQADAS
jgi:hypothetical protein